MSSIAEKSNSSRCGGGAAAAALAVARAPWLAGRFVLLTPAGDTGAAGAANGTVITFPHVLHLAFLPPARSSTLYCLPQPAHLTEMLISVSQLCSKTPLNCASSPRTGAMRIV